MIPNYCNFSTIGTIPETGLNVLQCSRSGCGRSVKTRVDNLLAICRVQDDDYVPQPLDLSGEERPTAETLPCSLRGGETKFKVDCGCGGNIPLVVYACEVFKYCTVPSLNRRTIVDNTKVECCLGCDRRK